MNSLLDYFGFTLLYEVPIHENFTNIASNFFYIKRTLIDQAPLLVPHSKLDPLANNSYYSQQLSEEKLVQVEKSRTFSRLGDIFYEQINLGEIEKALAPLDEIMRLLDMRRDICLSGIEDLCRVIADVSERLIQMQEKKVAEKLVKTALLFVNHKQNPVFSP